METFNEISTIPAAWLLDSKHLSASRLDASYYATKHLRDRNRLESLSLSIKDFRDICTKLNCGATPKLVEYTDKGVPLIRTSNVRPNIYDDSDVQRVPYLTLAPESNVAVLPGDIVYTMSGTVGYVAVYPEVGEIASCSNTIARGRVTDEHEYNPYYVASFLNSSLGYSQSQRLVSGGVLGHVMPNPVKRLRIALPRPEIQRAIGCKLRKSERLRRYYAATMKSVQDELARVLGVQAEENIQPLPSPECNWIASSSTLNRIDAEFYRRSVVKNEEDLLRVGNAVRIADLVEPNSPITNGIRGPELADSEFRMLRLQDVDGLWLDSSRSLCVSERQYRENKRAWCLPGDILLAVGGYIGVVGKVVDSVPQTMGQHSARLRFNSTMVDRDYMLAFFSSTRGSLLCQRYVSGAVQAGINLEDVREIRLPLPTLCQQKRVGDLVRAAESYKMESKLLRHSAESNVEALFCGTLDENALLTEGKHVETWLRTNPPELG